MAAGLEVLGHLTILSDDEDRLRVEFRGDIVALELPDLRRALAIRRKIPRLQRRAWLRRVQAALARAGLELQVWIGRRQVGRLAAGSRPGRVATWLGLDPMELRVCLILAMLARRRLTPGPGDDGAKPPDSRAEPS